MGAGGGSNIKGGGGYRTPLPTTFEFLFTGMCIATVSQLDYSLS